MIDEVKQLQIFEVEIPNALDLLFLLVLNTKLEGVHRCSEPRMPHRLLVLLLVVLLGQRQGNNLRIFDVEDGLEGDETVRVFGLEAHQVEERHRRVKHLHILLLQQILPDLERVLLLHLWIPEDAPAGENGRAGDQSPEEDLLEYARVQHN